MVGDSSPARAALLAAADGLEAQAKLLRAAAAALPESDSDGDARLTLREAAARFRVSGVKLRKAIKSGELPAVVGTRQQKLVRAQDLNDWCAKLRVEAQFPAAANDLDPIPAMIARGELVATR